MKSQCNNAKTNLSFFFFTFSALKRNLSSASSMPLQNYQFCMNLMNLQDLRYRRSTKVGKTFRTTLLQSQGINSKNRENCEDEDQFESHDHFVSKEARWNTALHNTPFKHFGAIHVNITELKKCKHEQMNAPADIAICTWGNLLS